MLIAVTEERKGREILLEAGEFLGKLAANQHRKSRERG
jgi:hypothetical protein